MGTLECTSYDNSAETDSPSIECPRDSCLFGTRGPCRQAASGVCWPYYFGTSVCPAGTAACATKPVRESNKQALDTKGAPASIAEDSGAYVVTMASQEIAEGTVELTDEPCQNGQSNWGAFCLPLVITLEASSARVLQGTNAMCE